MSGFIGGGGALQQSYTLGPSIAETTALGPVIMTDGGANNNDVLQVNKSPAGARSGNGITVAMNANTTGNGINVAMTSGATGTALLLTGNTATVSAPLFNATQTWNAGGVTFDGIIENITNTASAAGSRLINLQVGGNSAFNVQKTGSITVVSGALIGWSSSATNATVAADTALTRLSPANIQLTNGAAGLSNLSVSGVQLGGGTPSASQLTWNTGLGIINQIVGPNDQDFAIISGTTAATTGRALTLTSGIGLAGGAGGAQTLTAGTGQGAGNGGIWSGVGGTAGATGAGGAASVTGGSAVGGAGGAASLVGGAGAGTNKAAGGIVIDTGNSSGNAVETIIFKAPPSQGSGAGANTSGTIAQFSKTSTTATQYSFVQNATGSALSTTAVDGFLYVGSSAGTPAGTPTAFTGTNAITVDSTNNLLYFFSGGVWNKSSTAGATLQTAYNGGQTIAESSGNPVAISSTTADNANVLTVTKNPGGAQSGVGLLVTMGATTTGNGITVTQTAGASGFAADLSGARVTTAGQVTWATGLGAIKQILGPSDQVFNISTANNQNIFLSPNGTGILEVFQGGATADFASGPAGPPGAIGIVQGNLSNSAVTMSVASSLGVTWQSKTSRGTIALPTTLALGDTLLTYTGSGNDGTDFRTFVRWTGEVDSTGTVGVGSHPGAFVWSVTKNGSTGPDRVLALRQTGNLQIGSANQAVWSPDADPSTATAPDAGVRRLSAAAIQTTNGAAGLGSLSASGVQLGGGTPSASQLTWNTGLGAITQVSGPTDQVLQIQSGLTAGTTGNGLTVQAGSGAAGANAGGVLQLNGGLAGNAATAGGNIIFATAIATSGTTETNQWAVRNNGNLEGAAGNQVVWSSNSTITGAGDTGVNRRGVANVSLTDGGANNTGTLTCGGVSVSGNNTPIANAITWQNDTSVVRRGNQNTAIQCVDNSLTFPRGVQGAYGTLVKTANYTVLVLDSGVLFTNAGAAGEVDFSLPAIDANSRGWWATFYVATAQISKIIAPAATTIRLGGTVSASAGNITNSTVGACITLYSDGTNYFATAGFGAPWTVN